MSENAAYRDALRESILARPDVILEDPDVMRALVQANERSLGSNVVDLRGIAMERLEARLGRLEDTHRSVIAAAYENLAGTNQIHRAILALLEPSNFEGFLQVLGNEVAEILRVDCARLVLESTESDLDPALSELSGVLVLRPEGFIDDYMTHGRESAIRKVALRQTRSGDADLYGRDGDWIRSEACLKLELGPGRLPGLYALGAEDPHQFSPSQGTDLISFFAGTLERAIRRWLS